MSLVTSKELLLKAQKGKYAVGAFNVENMEMVQAVILAAEELSAPVILQTTPSTLRYASPEMFHAMVKVAAQRAEVPVCLHLDHGSSYELAVSCINSGYTSVMIDGSAEDFNKNVEKTKQVVGYAKVKGIPVEAELGKVGGKEDDLEQEADTNTNPEEAKEFVNQTGIDSLAIAIGTAHGFYQGEPVLDKLRISEVTRLVSIPLVLHGSSGLSDEDVRECVERGMCKVNFATELRAAYTNAIKDVIANDPGVYDPKVFGKAGIKAVKEQVKLRIKVCGSDGRA